MTASVYKGLLDEPLDTDRVEPEVQRRDLFLPPFFDGVLAVAAVALVLVLLLSLGLLAAIAARGVYGPQTAVAVLWPCWSAVLVGFISYALRTPPGRHRKAWR